MNDPIYEAQAYEIAKMASNISALKFQNSMLREQLQYELQTSRSRLESIDQLKKKNEELRELVQRMRRYIAGAVEHCGYNAQTIGYTMLGSRLEECENAMRELGIEVD